MAELKSAPCSYCGKMIMRLQVRPSGVTCEDCHKKRRAVYFKANWRKYSPKPSGKVTKGRTEYMATRYFTLKAKDEQFTSERVKRATFDCRTFQEWTPNKIAKLDMNDYVARTR